MPKPPVVVTVGRLVQVIDWVIKYLKSVKRRVCGKRTAAAQLAMKSSPSEGGWDVDCAPPKDPDNVEVCSALDACIASLEKLKRSFGHLPPRHPLA